MKGEIRMNGKKRMPVTDGPSEPGIVASSDIPTTDPLGSYTGRPLDPNELPIQDADDL